MIILQDDSTSEADPVNQHMLMTSKVVLSAFVVPMNAPPLYSIFGFYAALNALLFAILRHPRMVQVTRPCEDRDDRLHGFRPDCYPPPIPVLPLVLILDRSRPKTNLEPSARKNKRTRRISPP